MRVGTFVLYTSAITFSLFAAPVEAQGKGKKADGIPPGHRPPAGKCRVWVDGVPPGRQPAVTSCARAFATVPANGRVLIGTRPFGKQSPYYSSRYYWWNDGIQQWVVNQIWSALYQSTSRDGKWNTSKHRKRAVKYQKHEEKRRAAWYRDGSSRHDDKSWRNKKDKNKEHRNKDRRHRRGND